MIVECPTMSMINDASNDDGGAWDIWARCRSWRSRSWRIAFSWYQSVQIRSSYKSMIQFAAQRVDVGHPQFGVFFWYQYYKFLNYLKKKLQNVVKLLSDSFALPDWGRRDFPPVRKKWKFNSRPDFQIFIFAVLKKITYLRDGWIFGNVPKGMGGLFQFTKILLQILNL